MKPVSGDGAAVRSEVWPFVWTLAPLDSRCSLGVGKIERGDRALCIDEAGGTEAELRRASAEELLDIERVGGAPVMTPIQARWIKDTGRA